VKTKLTVTIDQDLLPRAKQFAQQKGVSLSSLIEDSLRQMSEQPDSSFAARWRGRFRPARRDEERYRQLARKYL
jgi:hypothetical protein